MARKTADDYAAEIRKLYPEVQLLKAYCEANPEDEATVKKLEQKQNTLTGKVKNLAKRSNPIIYVAKNEGIPWKAEDMPWSDTGRNVTIEPMPLKKDTKIKQVGDYICYIPELDVYYSRVVDRKSWDDMNGTFVDEDNRDRFFKEIVTFNADPRFKDIKNAKLEIYAECSKYDFLAKLAPYPTQCKFCTKVERVQSDDSLVYYCTERDLIPVKPDSSCKSFDSYKRSDGEIKALIKKKRTVLGQLKDAGVEVCWQGSRFEASHQYTVDVFEWIKRNYVKLLKLDILPYNDRIFLEDRKAALDAELERLMEELAAVNASLSQYITQDCGVLEVLQ